MQNCRGIGREVEDSRSRVEDCHILDFRLQTSDWATQPLAVLATLAVSLPQCWLTTGGNRLD
jgi:hypothetical protein